MNAPLGCPIATASSLHLERLQERIDRASRIVFFGGAGVSTESGLPDFRSVDGLYHQVFDYPPETMLSHDFLMRRPDDFYRFYRTKLLVPGIRPNAAHRKLAELESASRLSVVITQNIDGLHQDAGSTNVIELHGSIRRNFCMRCGRRYPLTAISESSGVPQCACGGMIRPDVVLYGEGLNEADVAAALDALRGADLLIIGGTSLAVYPAAGLIDAYRGSEIVVINRDPTPADRRASLVIQAPIAATLEKIRVQKDTRPDPSDQQP